VRDSLFVFLFDDVEFFLFRVLFEFSPPTIGRTLFPSA